MLRPRASAAVLRAQRMNRNIAIWSRGVDRAQFNPERRSLEWRRSLGIGHAHTPFQVIAQADLLDWFKGNDRPKAPSGKPLNFTQPAQWQSTLAKTPEEKVTGYNNFYEFGLDKADPAANAGSLKTSESSSTAASLSGAGKP